MAPLAKHSAASFNMVPEEYPQNCFTHLRCFGKQGSMDFHLPLPNQLAYQTGFEWSTYNVPVPAQRIIDKVNYDSQKGFTYGDKPISANTDSLGDVGKDALEDIKKSTKDIGKMFLVKAGDAISQTVSNGTGISKAVQSKFGVTYNPNKTLFFDGISQRSFTMSFDIVPTSREMSSACAMAIKQMRVKASPSYSDTRAFFTYPSYFALTVVANGKAVLEYFKCALTNIGTNLTPNGVMSWHDDGKPVAYVLELSGTEVETQTAQGENMRRFLGV